MAPEQRITVKITFNSDGILLRQMNGKYLGPVKLMQLVAAAAIANPQGFVDSGIIHVYHKI